MVWSDLPYSNRLSIMLLTEITGFLPNMLLIQQRYVLGKHGGGGCNPYSGLLNMMADEIS